MNDFLQRLDDALEPVADAGALVVALSGGLDSTVLLHGLYRLKLAQGGRTQSPGWSLRALHINHGLHNRAGDWQQFCEAYCAFLDVPLSIRAVMVAREGSVEAAARDARYRAFRDDLQSGEVLVTAQHRDDQLETLLLRLMRGAGPAGLAGMPRSRTLGQGTLLRPLLDFSRVEILAYAREHQLEWIEDPSNSDTDMDRNYCRHELLPRVEQRWPAYRDSWQKSQVLLAESGQLLQELAALDLARLGVDGGTALPVAALLELSPPRQRNLLRHWLQRLGLDAPGWNRLQQLCKEVLAAGADSNAAIKLGSTSILVHAGLLQAVNLPVSARSNCQIWNAAEQSRLALPDNGELHARTETGGGLGSTHARALRVGYRQGGESIRLPGRPCRPLKKLLQESGLPPWLRNRIPLLYAGGQLVFIPGIGAVQEFTAAPDEPGLVIDWQQPDFVVRACLN